MFSERLNQILTLLDVTSGDFARFAVPVPPESDFPKGNPYLCSAFRAAQSAGPQISDCFLF